jgi:serine protease Do
MVYARTAHLGTGHFFKLYQNNSMYMKHYLKTIVTGFIAGVTGALAVNHFTTATETPEAFTPIHYTDSGHSSFTGFERMPLAGNANLNESFVAASAASTPSVVYIKTVAGQEATSWMDMFFYGNRGQSVSSGSGVIYSGDGYIITNNHVIDKAENIEVIHDKRSYKAIVVGTDPSTDLAVLKVEASNLPNIKFGESRQVQVGEWVLAVGNPFNLNSTVTAGIVSAMGRNISILSSQFPLESFIQTDAAINPGNSGGALVNTRGELIGINTAIYSRTGSYTGYAFAIPSDVVAKVVHDIIKYGEVQRAFVGADFADIDAKVAAQLNTNDYSGVLVTSVDRGGAADRAGLQPGDVITKINGRQVNSRGTLDEEVSYYNPGDKVKVTYRREKKQNESQLTLTNREGTTGLLRREIYASERLGAELEVISKVERNKLNVDNGVRVVKAGNGIIRRMNITEGFVITAINRNKVESPRDVERYLMEAKGKTVIEFVNPSGVKGYYSVYFQ